MKTSFLYKGKLWLSLVLSLVLVTACSDDDEFILRSTDNLAFAYSGAAQTFTICSSGSWSLDSSADWLQIDKSSGKGDGVTREVITVTANRNKMGARDGDIRMHTVQGELLIKVSQDDGYITFNRASLNGALIQDDQNEGVNLLIPYIKGVVGDVINFTTNVSGAGATGITVADIAVTLDSEEGNILIPVMGTPTVLDDVYFEITSDIAGLDALEVAAKVTDGVYFEQMFDLMVWGGDCVANIKGIKGAFKAGVGGSVINESVTPTECTAGTDGSNDLIATMAPSYRELRGFAGWSGKRVYERPGFIKVSTAGSVDGFVLSPSFADMGVPAGDVEVSFKASQYFDDTDGKLLISASQGGQVSVSEFALKPGSARVWETFTFVIEGATADTQIKIAAEAVAKRRFSLDEIVISKKKNN